MGDIADWLCSQHEGHDDWDDDEGYAPAEKPTCKFCGKRNLTWGHTYKGWKLFEGFDRPHVCNKTSTDDFEDLTK